MYDYIKGHLTQKQSNSYRGTYLVVENNGIGYLILTGKSTVKWVKDDDEIKVYVSLIHKEDSMNLIGFITKEERDIFNILQSVSGIGVKMALMILDEFTISELIDIMIREDAKMLSRAKGVGAKVAQKIIIELKDKLINWSNATPVDISDINTTEEISNDIIVEVQSVLISLGYTVNEVKGAIKEVLNSKKDCKKSEDILKHALEYLSQTT